MDALMLPLNWQRVRLGDITNYLTSNLSAEQITQQGKIKVYDVNNFIGYTDTTFISDKPYISIVKDGSVGRVRILPPKTNILSTMGALIANHRTTTEFLFYLLSNFDFKNFTSGSIIPHIYFKDYKEKTIFLPPLNEQSAIANILSALDRYLCALDALILKKEGVKKALSFELLSQRKRLKGFNQAWQRVRLGDITNYLTLNLSAEQITQQGKIKVYDVNNFIGYTDTTFISDKPYISIVKDGSVGRVRILPPKTNILSTMGALIANHRTTTEFLFYLLSNFDFKNFTSGSIIPHIYFKDYKEKTIFLPPLNEQSAIANILSTLDNEITSLKNKKRQFENIKKALNHDLMSAKIRVLEK
ncbi:restriction endonuclease subunit S [Helicobacter pylori]|uniref:restriction endonuclease subunit S n=1 Tax=Helicobacter pylori TaxID=210 RepID=UPI001FD51B6C|nr:restriction endonuclease subunit S [Helicobacter pylori]UOR29328.1 restriction endonuclease subunit S [Helicobacter pylori]